MELALAIWGGALSSLLAVREVLVWRRDRAIVDVTAEIVTVSVPADTSDRDPRCVVVKDERGLERGLIVGLTAVNRGHRPIQILRAYFDDGKSEHQVTARGLPAVLEPGTRVELQLQPEWVATHGNALAAMGLLDGLGRKHAVVAETRDSIFRSIGMVETRVTRYRRKEGADPRMDDGVTAFQAFDPSVLIRHTTGRRPLRRSRHSSSA